MIIKAKCDRNNGIVAEIKCCRNDDCCQTHNQCLKFRGGGGEELFKREPNSFWPFSLDPLDAILLLHEIQQLDIFQSSMTMFPGVKLIILY